MSLSVLLVDDEPDILSSMGRILRQDGFHVDTATSIAEATDRENWSDYFAVLLDRKLPDGLSDDLIPKIKRLAPQAAIFVITAYAALESSLASLRNGVEDYLLKPIEPAAVLHRLHRVREMQQAEERARQAERLAAIGQMMTGLTHESRNALQRATANLEMLEFDLENRPDLLELTHRTKKALDDLHRLFEEVRGYAAPIKLERVRYDLQRVWSRTWKNLEGARGGKDVQLREETNGLQLQCLIDPRRIEQVIRNIFENSIAVVPEAGEIVVRCADADINGAPAIRVSFRDNGPGLTTEQAQSIFDPFFTTKKKGTGLGMAIAKQIVEAHGGTIEVKHPSQPGAEIIVTLPREAE